ncbi:hypothetical protein [Vreelandella malpeensis]|uniref:Uncharacterized protein n=1 Tax=Vreelandella malpeensis TaxID=1172368 RepID=A0ABS8DTC6_9GAMM|nr:hypothetical protein [Halomonas malpeensis]MCB8889569.1 hypothetical protein [Halomonas malpeensis]
MESSKPVEEIKSGMLLYLNSDIESIAEQSENSEILGFWNRTQAVAGAMMMQKLLSDGELKEIHARIAASVETA